MTDFLEKRTDSGPTKGAAHHIENEEHTGQHAKSCVTAVEFRLEQFLHGEKHGPIDVVQQVQRSEKREGNLRIALLRGHVSSEYITLPRRP